MKRGQRKKAGGSGVSKADIGKLQGILLSAILSSQPLPGSDDPLNFPDLATIVNQPKIFVVDENLGSDVRVKAPPKPVQILSNDKLKEQAETGGGDLTYLHFQAPEVSDNSLGLTVAGKIMPRDPQQRTLGLSTIQVKFYKVDDEWLVQESPAMSAS